jgi:type IV pilus assembly protein PilA
MRIPKRGEKGFTLIELLIVVAILGVLAAVVIPNVSRFLGRGKTEAAATEFANIQSAVASMMVDNSLATLATPVTTTHQNDMTVFPDTTPAGSKGKDSLGNSYTGADGAGFVLYGHDRIAGGGTANLTNYVATRYTSYWYTVDAYGTVIQYDVP